MLKETILLSSGKWGLNQMYRSNWEDQWRNRKVSRTVFVSGVRKGKVGKPTAGMTRKKKLECESKKYTHRNFYWTQLAKKMSQEERELVLFKRKLLQSSTRKMIETTIESGDFCPTGK